MQRLRRTSWMGLVVLGGLGLWAVHGWSSSEAADLEAARESVEPVSRFSGHPRQTPVVKLVQRARGAVVNIHSERLVKDDLPHEIFAFSPSGNRINGMGTGIIIDPRGYIITNHHVIDQVNLIRVRLADGKSVGAVVLARDSDNDLALLKVNVDHPLPVMPMGTSKDLMVGETVVAIGNAYGYHHTVTVGVVSAIDRDVKLNREISYKDLIQTDASINPGNSGGPLMNIRGELIGVNVAIRAGAQGIGFAIPVDTMLELAAKMLRQERLEKNFAGIHGRDQVRLVSELGELPAERSVVVEHVTSDSPAAKAGLKSGDVVLHVGTQPVRTVVELERALLAERSGRTVSMDVRRGAKVERLRFTLDGPRREIAAEQLIRDRLGLGFRRVSGEEVRNANRELEGGLFVIRVEPGSPGDRAGIRTGDVLIGLHQWEMLEPDNVVYVLNHPERATFNPVRFYILREGQVHRGWLRPQE